MDKLNKVCTNFEQDFTESEKAQARRNIGAQQELIQGSNISIVGNTISAIVPTPEPPPIPQVNDAQLTIQKNGTTVGTFTANASVPSVVNIAVPPDNLFIAEYDVSTWAQVKAAYDAGKAIILVGADFGSNIHTQMSLYNYSTTSGQTEKFMFAPTVTPRVAPYIKYYATIDETDGWSKDYFSNGYPTLTGGVFQLTGDETAYDLVTHRGWLSNNVFNFDVKFFCSPNACNIYLAYVDQPYTVDIVGTRRNVRNDLKAAIDLTTTVQSLVTSIDVWNRIVMTGETLNSTTPRIDLATLGPQELSNYDYDVYWDLDIILNRMAGENKPCYHLHIEKFGQPTPGHSYLYATLTGSDLA